MCLVYISLYALCFFVLLGGLGILVGYAMQGNYKLALAGLGCAYVGYWLLKQLPKP